MSFSSISWVKNRRQGWPKCRLSPVAGCYFEPCITLEQKINLAQIPHPSKATFRFPLPGHYVQSNARGMRGGGGGLVLKLQFDQYITWNKSYMYTLLEI